MRPHGWEGIASPRVVCQKQGLSHSRHQSCTVPSDADVGPSSVVTNITQLRESTPRRPSDDKYNHIYMFVAILVASTSSWQCSGRRQFLATTVAATGAPLLTPQASNAFPPPVGDVALLKPLLLCKSIIAHQDAAVRAARAAGSVVDWSGLQQALTQPPFTSRDSKQKFLVGSLFLAASEAYDASLRYTAEIDESDRTFCYVSKAVKVDEQCVQRLYTSDRTYRVLLRNEVLTSLQEIESEASYLSRCAMARSSKTSADGIVCPDDPTEDEAAMISLLAATLANFDKMFASVGPNEMRQAASQLTLARSPVAATLPSSRLRAGVVRACAAHEEEEGEKEGDGNSLASSNLPPVQGAVMVSRSQMTVSRSQMTRVALLVAWACLAKGALGSVLNFPPPSFNVVARDIYAEAQSGSVPATADAVDALRVLELGCGAGCKSVFDDRFRAGADVVAVDVDIPDAATLQRAQARSAERGFAFRFEQGDATALRSFADASFDVVVCSLTLCSVPSAEAAIAEVVRVLRPSGRFGFIEHVRVNKEDGRPLLGLSQKLLDPLQQVLAHGCHLQRDTPSAIIDAFGGPSCVLRLQRMVNEEMWPVSQQAAGVVVKSSF